MGQSTASIKIRAQGRKDQSVVRRLFGSKPSRPSTSPLSIIALNRMAFGPRPGDLEAFEALGNTEDEQFEAYVEQQLDPGSIDDSDLDSKLAGFPTLQKSVSELWTEHLLGAGGDYLIQNQPFHESEAAVFVRAVHSRRQLVQVLGDFWFNHFNVFPEDVLVTSVFSHYEQDVIRAHALGNFREMLEAVATSPAMLFYLDNVASRNSGPNENFSRELFELHTLGAENYLGVGLQSEVPKDEAGNPIGYVDADVFEATRCFTGWTFDDDVGAFLYRSDWHDRFQKNVLGGFFRRIKRHFGTAGMFSTSWQPTPELHDILHESSVAVSYPTVPQPDWLRRRLQFSQRPRMLLTSWHKWSDLFCSPASSVVPGEERSSARSR